MQGCPPWTAIHLYSPAASTSPLPSHPLAIHPSIYTVVSPSQSVPLLAFEEAPSGTATPDVVLVLS